MEYQDRSQWEAGLKTAIAAVWANHHWPLDPEQMGRELDEAIREHLTDVQRRVVIAMLIWLMMQEDTPATRRLRDRFEANPEAARLQAEAQARQLAIEFATALEHARTAAPEDPDEREQWVRDVLLSDGRADRIAATEITRAISFGEWGSVFLMSQIGIEAYAVWYTADDARVCPICGPFHGKGYEVWGDLYPTGSPAHPVCRCHMEWFLRRTGAERN